MTGSETEVGARDGAGSGGDSWTVLRLILWSADYLKEKGVESGRLDAEHLLAHVVGVGRLQLYLDFERPLTSAELDGFRPLLKRRAAREPLQYIIGRQPFRELDLEVEPGVLIPRPETEVLVEEVLAWLSTRASSEDVTALDVGAGAGAICLSLAHEGSIARVIAVEVADQALEVARRNRDSAQLSDRVDLRRGSLFEPLSDGEVFDVIVSNPPYVPEVDEASLEPEVRDWEPRDALFAGQDGLDVLRQITTGARAHLKPGGLLALEVGAGQPATVAALIADTGQYEEIRILRDYAGKERFVFAHGA
jgi:release factor glutamine methyltransferase